MTKKWIASVLLASLLTSLVSCGGETAPATETTADTVPAEAQNTQETYESSIPKQDFGGEKIKVLTFTTTEYMNSAQDINATELTGELLNDAVYNRNTLLVEKFNISFDISDAGNFQNIITVVNDTVIAGDTEALDILLGSAYSMTSCGLNGSIHNPRYPLGGYSVERMASSTCAAVSRFGKMIPSTPISRIRFTWPGSST